MNIKLSNKSKPNNGVNEAVASSEVPPFDVLLVSRMRPVVIELFRIGGQREGNGLKKRAEL